MPTILLLGPRCSGKSTVADYLVDQEDFQRVRFRALAQPDNEDQNTFASTSAASSAAPVVAEDGVLYFSDAASFLDYATMHWRKRYVTCGITRRKELDAFIKRPWVLLVGCEAGLLWRWQRYTEALRREAGDDQPTFEDFVRQDDEDTFGAAYSSVSDDPEHSDRPSTQTLHIPNGYTAHTMTLSAQPPPSPELSFRSLNVTPSRSQINGSTRDVKKDPLAPLLRMCNLHIQTSRYASREALYAHLKFLELTKEDRMRPGWDIYFMTLAGLASLRSNCMKRRVGAVLVSNKRVISTGYNGTPRGMRNCNEGGCARCNSTSVTSKSHVHGSLTPVKSGVALDECLCLHAEENALLEAGRERAGAGSGGVLYCNTCPCLRCSVKIVQCGISEVVYSQSYSMDEASARIFAEAGIIMRQVELPQ